MCVILKTLSELYLKYLILWEAPSASVFPCSLSAPEGRLLRVGFSSSSTSVHFESFEHHSGGLNDKGWMTNGAGLWIEPFFWLWVPPPSTFTGCWSVDGWTKLGVGGCNLWGCAALCSTVVFLCVCLVWSTFSFVALWYCGVLEWVETGMNLWIYVGWHWHAWSEVTFFISVRVRLSCSLKAGSAFT